jgi:hypothetical protein
MLTSSCKGTLTESACCPNLLEGLFLPEPGLSLALLMTLDNEPNRLPPLVIFVATRLE